VNGSSTTLEYDADRFWTKKITTDPVSGTGSKLNYQLRDPDGRIRQVRNLFLTSGNEDWDYDDDFGQLTTADNLGTNARIGHTPTTLPAT
jgi:hypothetical protein